MNDKLNESISAGTVQTIEEMLGLQAVAGEVVTAPDNSNGAGTSTIISFVGEISGAFVLRCEKEAAAALAGEMLGMEVAPDSEDMKDSIGELLNMIVGAAKSRYASNNAFKISVPTTITGADYSFYIKADPSDTICRIPFEIGAHELSIDVYLKGN